MVAQGYIGRHPGDSSVVISRQSFTASGITTDFTFASGYTVGYFDLYINGVRLIEGTDYTASDSATFTVLNGGAQNGDVLEGVAYKAFNLGDASRIGIQSAGIQIGNAETLNFVGTGNTFSVNGTTIDVSISGSAGAGGTWATYDSNTGITTTKKVKIDNSLEVTGVSTFTGIATFASNIDANGGITATTGTFEDLTGAGAIVFSTGDGILDDSPSLSYTSGTNTLNVQNIDVDGHTELDQLRVSGFSTLQGGARWYSTLHGMDNGQMYFGDSYDLRIVHDGNTQNSKIWQWGPGELQIHTNTKIAFNHQDSANSGNIGSMAQFIREGACELYHNDSKKFETTTTGIAVSGIVTATSGIVTYYGDGQYLTGIEVGLTTAAHVANNAVVTLDLTAAQDHKITATGICTITVTGGIEADSHTVRLINSGIATVGFSTYFLFPSGATPSLPEADGSISLLSFTVNRVGAGGTQLLTGASLNYS